MTRFVPALAVALASLALLTACTTAAPLTVSPDDVATTAENALEEQVGSRPDIDCGTDDVPLVKGRVIDCVLTDPVSGDQFEAPVTIEEVDGTNYTIGIQVGAEPIN